MTKCVHPDVYQSGLFTRGFSIEMFYVFLMSAVHAEVSQS